MSEVVPVILEVMHSKNALLLYTSSKTMLWPEPRSQQFFKPIVAIPVRRDLKFELNLDTHSAMKNTNISSSDWTRRRWTHSSPSTMPCLEKPPGIHALCHSHYHSTPFPHLASNHLAIGGKFAVDIMIIVSKKVPSTLCPTREVTLCVLFYIFQKWKVSDADSCVF